MDSNKIKQIIKDMGATLCGIAPIHRFSEAPEGFHPTDIYNDCESVIVFAKRVPSESLFARNCVPYTFVNDVVTQKVDHLTVTICMALEKLGVKVVPIPSDDPYEHWEPERSYGRAILSMRHAGYLAGLGVLGKNTLLANKELGNMIQLGAILTSLELEGDLIANYEHCPPNCSLCIDNCPAKALDGTTVNQKLCRPLSIFVTKKGYNLKKCNICRRICPHLLGLK
ncbi:MAG: epoxyqueuosine reductase [Chloroflexi bacterium]|jgi:epoxyqueuosine reductase|nr:epoxyqueuosine reductase [Chloroflexota bacterium]MBT7081363.1 epoxyqueuosine reductase [Chloroflexota bacterium]MBT7290671.1 epoxyqueuosine reductase [Chloroflexota bacterium]